MRVVAGLKEADLVPQLGDVVRPRLGTLHRDRLAAQPRRQRFGWQRRRRQRPSDVDAAVAAAADEFCLCKAVGRRLDVAERERSRAYVRRATGWARWRWAFWRRWGGGCCVGLCRHRQRRHLICVGLAQPLALLLTLPVQPVAHRARLRQHALTRQRAMFLEREGEHVAVGGGHRIAQRRVSHVSGSSASCARVAVGCFR